MLQHLAGATCTIQVANYHIFLIMAIDITAIFFSEISTHNVLIFFGPFSQRNIHVNVQPQGEALLNNVSIFLIVFIYWSR